MSEDVHESLRLIEDLKFFLVTAPANWQENQVIRRYYLNNDEGFVSCVFWKNLYFITGTDIVRCILYKFQHFGRTIVDRKKFEEGIFSDLRNLKAGADAILEKPKSEFLEFLYKNSCLRTQKKQKVFYWFNVPHDKLMADALDRDIKREKAGQQPTSVATKEPALSFRYNENNSMSLLDQLNDHLSSMKGPEPDPIKKSPLPSPLPQPDDNLQQDLQNTLMDGLQYPSIKDYNDIDADDDFPLDYFGRDPNFYPSDHIALDSALHTGSFITSYDNPEPLDSPFINASQAATNIASTEDYLIEQTQPTKPPVPQSAAAVEDMHFPNPSSSLSAQAAMATYPYAYPMGPYGPQLGTATAPFFPQPYMPPYQPSLSAMMSHFLDPTFNYDQTPMQPYSEEIWPYEGPGQGNYFEKDYELMYSSRPSLRQREISYSMMRKRRLLQQTRGVSKPLHSKGDRNGVLELETRIKEKMKSEPPGHKETLIPTPESSVNQH